MSRSARGGSRSGYARYLRAVVFGLVALLMVGIIALGLGGRRGGSGGAPGAVTLAPEDRQQVSAGRELYARNCAACHGASLEGQAGWQSAPPGGPSPAPPLDGSSRARALSDAQLFGITKDGGQASAPAEYINAMPAFGGTLSDDDIRAILSYIKSTWPAQ